MSAAETLEKTSLRELLKEFANMKAVDFIRAEELGVAFNFQDAVTPLDALLALYRDLAQCDLNMIPEAVIKNHLALGGELKKCIEAIQQFNPKQANATVVRDQLIERIRSIYDGQWLKISPTLAYCAGKGRNLEQLRQQVTVAETAFHKATADAQESYKVADDRAKQILRGIEEAAAKVGVDQHAIQFSKQADEHRFFAYLWMAATVVLAGSGALLLHYFFMGGGRPVALDAPDTKTGLIVFEVVTRLMVFSFVSFGMYWAAKNYASHRHNYVVNRHRQNALSTFKAFVAAAGSDDGTKNAVLVQASQAIYAPQTSGYIDASGSSGQQTAGIIEFVKSASNKGE